MCEIRALRHADVFRDQAQLATMVRHGPAALLSYQWEALLKLARRSALIWQRFVELHRLLPSCARRQLSSARGLRTAT